MDPQPPPPPSSMTYNEIIKSLVEANFVGNYENVPEGLAHFNDQYDIFETQPSIVECEQIKARMTQGTAENDPSSFSAAGTVVQGIYAENLNKAQESTMPASLGLGAEVTLPMYKEPTDTAVYHENTAKNLAFSERLQGSFKQRKLEENEGKMTRLNPNSEFDASVDRFYFENKNRAAASHSRALVLPRFPAVIALPSYNQPKETAFYQECVAKNFTMNGRVRRSNDLRTKAMQMSQEKAMAERLETVSFETRFTELYAENRKKVEEPHGIGNPSIPGHGLTTVPALKGEELSDMTAGSTAVFKPKLQQILRCQAEEDESNKMLE